MKIHIIFEFKDGPYGGGNQFLKALRSEFFKHGEYADHPREAEIFLFNSFQDIRRVLELKKQYQHKPFVHRIDGPISLYRGTSDTSVDEIIFALHKNIADAVVFQSRFSQKENARMGLVAEKNMAIIPNACDPAIFFPALSNTYDFTKRKLKIISTSWSSNMMKGFSTYQYLDSHLDFSRYDYTFIGRSPVRFRNIKVIKPQPSKEIAEHMRRADLYITASHKDPCSNSLIEALTCGLPAVARNDGGHPELIGQGGCLFEKDNQISSQLETIRNRYQTYKNQIPTHSLEGAYRAYRQIMQSALTYATSGQKPLKKLTNIKRWLILAKTIMANVS